mmetsp:Transcript_40523/g.93149  ORF Transcript_40523/g.93149 Transcript_40523/m.93149 type:complete len:87 (-) Transcript_40523:8-268(-)
MHRLVFTKLGGFCSSSWLCANMQLGPYLHLPFWKNLQSWVFRICERKQLLYSFLGADAAELLEAIGFHLQRLTKIQQLLWESELYA